MKVSAANWAILSFLLSLSAFASAADPVLNAEWPGFRRILPQSAASVVTLNGRAYLASSGGARGAVFDVANPQSPRLLSDAEFAADPFANALTRRKIFELAWPHIVVAADQWTLETLDLSTGSPVHVGYIPGSVAQSVSISQQRAFVANFEYMFDGFGEVCWTGGNFFIYDIADSANPRRLSGGGNGPRCGSEPWFFSRDYYGAAAEGNIFAAGYSGIVRLYDFSTGVVGIISEVPVRGWVPAMKLKNGFLYCAGNAPTGNGLLTIVDARNPAAPRIVAEVAAGVGPNGLWIEDGFAYLSDPQFGLIIVDVRDPAAARVVAGFEMAGAATSVAATGENVFVADNSGGLRALRHNAGTLEPIATVRAPANPASIRIAGKRGYAANSSGLAILDLQNPASPVIDGIYSTNSVLDVALSGDRVYLSRGARGIDVLNVANSTQPTLIANLAQHAYHACLRIDRFLYAPGSQYPDADVNISGVHVLDLADERAPQRVARLDILTPRAITRHGDFAYVAAASNGWAVVEVRFPGFPAVLARHSSGRAWIERVIRSGDRAYVLDRTNQRLDVYNVADIYNPVRVGRFSGLTDAHDFTLSGFYAYIADGVGGVKALRLPDETARLEWIADRRFRLTGPDGLKGRILRSFDLTEWSLLQEIELSAGSAEIADAESSPQAFYTFISP